ncbi:LacI family DNA-binding transcriptional regulator [Fredinandcohnia onubensis]|uniref:LacI family DNA-binding transcriptional regulator n=1 Tax=Fredinandcohnia onubensis TaxID=1571209 RepID=UPI000C0BFB1A|nr:LacI family DNA-binding transcriptional regulator [Fredinandcohnia onubensis]
MATIYEVAKRANVSAMTVSRVINNHKSIRAETRDRVFKAIKELDYIPNSTARSLISKDSKLLGLIITDITNPFFTNISRGAEDKASEKGYQVVFSNSDENLEKESAYIRSVISRGIDGLLYAPTNDFSKSNVETLKKHNIPFVLVDREIEGIDEDLVIGDNKQSIYCLMDYLVKLGHSKIAFVSGPVSISNTREREKAYLNYIKENNLFHETSWSYFTSLTNINVDEFLQLFIHFSIPERPTAIIATNNFISIELIKGLNKHGFSVPENVSIVSFDDPSPLPLHKSLLTLIKQPAYDIGYLGMELLIQKIEGKECKKKKKIVLPTNLLIGESTTTAKDGNSNIKSG